MTINITGDTDYSEGMEYLVTLTDVHTTVRGGNAATRETTFTSNSTLLNNLTTGLWKGTCNNYTSLIDCAGKEMYAYTYLNGDVSVYSGNSNTMHCK